MKYKKIHFVGIKGVGMTPLALIAKEAGCVVTGSDVADEFITDKALKKQRILVYASFDQENVKGADLVVTTGAHGGFENVEVQAAKRENIPVVTQGEAAGLYMKGAMFGRKFEGISVAGTHGKTTTTAMIATIFKECGLSPSYIIGTSEIPSLEGPGHLGKGKYFISEADEYATEPIADPTPKLLWQHPSIALLTNIELDHPDFYSSVDEIREVFLQFANKISPPGVLIANGDDPQIRKLLSKFKGRAVTFGNLPVNTYVLKNVRVSSAHTFFWVESKGVSLGEFALAVPGYHNALNALGSIVVANECNIPLEQVKKALLSFKGSKRRFEYKGTIRGTIMLYDDYAHHPTEIKATLRAFRQRFPKEYIICVFQPHTYSRTKKLFDDFIYSFNDADEVIITNIYASMREKPDSSVSVEKLVEQTRRIHGNVHFLPNLSSVVQYIDQKSFSKPIVLVTMGAGDIYKAHDLFRLK